MDPVCRGDLEFSGLWYWCSTDQFAATKTEKKQRKARHPTVKSRIEFKEGHIKPPVLNDSQNGTYWPFN